MSSENQNIQSRVQTKSILLSFLLMLFFGGASSTHAQWTSSGGNTTTNDKVGVGTSSPTQSLDAVGLIKAKRAASGDSTGINIGSSGLDRPAAEFRVSDDSLRAKIEVNGVNNSNGDRLGLFAYHVGSLNENVSILGNGNVGIGTTSPGNRFSINTHASDAIPSLGSNGGSFGLFKYDNVAGGNYGLLAGVMSSGNVFQQAQRVDGIPYAYHLLLQPSGGNVGIGTQSPANKLAINITANDSLPSLGSNGGSFGLFKYDNVAGGNYGLLAGVMSSGNVFQQVQRVDGIPYAYHLLLQPSGGNVGIGTPSPGVKLHVSDGPSTRTQVTLSDNNTASLMLRAGNSQPGTVASDVNLQFRTGANYLNADSGGQTVMTLDTTGNVGIGITGPTEKLEVNGNLKLTGTGNINASGTIEAGNIKAKYQDVAEWVPASDQLSAGTVVVLDSTKSNQVTSSSVSYDTRVAGVVSEHPGLALGEKSEGKVLVATTGRVFVKVDASRAPIHIGDLLVTSDIPGVAMKSEPMEINGRKFHQPGTLIGKAQEPLEKGKGTILVLLSLQ